MGALTGVQSGLAGLCGTCWQICRQWKVINGLDQKQWPKQIDTVAWTIGTAFVSLYGPHLSHPDIDQQMEIYTKQG